MRKLSLREIARISGSEVATGGSPPADVFVSGYSFDTRRLKPGDLFFALEGETRDGHAFVKEALTKGAVGAVVSHPVEGVDGGFTQLVVKSPLEALQRTASHERQRIDIPVIAISGSNGKTTTKDMLAMLLEDKMRVHKSPGNFNNHIGVPLSILGLDEADQVLVVEMGSNHRGEIRRLCEIARPTVGLITNIGRAHIGHFGSIEEIAAEKTDILRSLEPGSRGVVNGDDPILRPALAGLDLDLITFGLSESAGVRAAGIRQTGGGGIAFSVGDAQVRLKCAGLHNVYNALAAMAAAGPFGITYRDAAGILAGYEPLRMKTTRAAGLTIVDDTYNANPDSVKAAIKVISVMDGPRRVFVMGEMLELGESAETLHGEVGRWVASSRIDVLIGIGGMTRSAVEAAVESGMGPESAVFFADKEEAIRRIPEIMRPDDIVLVKGSRMTGLDEIAEALKQHAVKGRA